jgi:hypothetical protein
MKSIADQILANALVVDRSDGTTRVTFELDDLASFVEDLADIPKFDLQVLYRRYLEHLWSVLGVRGTMNIKDPIEREHYQKMTWGVHQCLSWLVSEGVLRESPAADTEASDG